MCEFCGCGEPSYPSVSVAIPTLHVIEAETSVTVVANDDEEDDE